MEHVKLYVVVPNWNGKDFIAECLDSLKSQTIIHKVVVVDNGSTDGSQVLIKQKYSEVELIELDKNYGFTGGVNAGIEFAINLGAEYVCLLNNDAVADKNWLINLHSSIIKSKKIGITTSKILRDDRKHLDSTGDFYSIWGIPFPRGRNEVDTGQYDKLTSIFSASGGASIYKVEMLKQIGLFDQAFFAYFEDVDISFRAQLKGWKVTYEPSAIVYHKVNGTSSKLGDFSRYHSIKNFCLVYTKNMPGILYFKYLPLFWAQLARWFVGSLLRGKLIVFLNASLKVIILLPITFYKRIGVQLKKEVSANYIDELLYKKRPPKTEKYGD